MNTNKQTSYIVALTASADNINTTKSLIDSILA